MNSDSLKSCCASVCTVVAAVAVPVLVYIALLCGAGSRLIEIPQERKTSAAVGCWVAAALYVEIILLRITSYTDTLQLSSSHIITKLGGHSKGLTYAQTATSYIKCHRINEHPTRI